MCFGAGFCVGGEGDIRLEHKREAYQRPFESAFRGPITRHECQTCGNTIALDITKLRL